MRPMAAAAVGALIAGVAVYAVNARAAQDNPFAEVPALVQTVDGRFIQVPDARTIGFAPNAYAPMGFTTAPQAAPRVVQQAPPRVVQQAPAPARVYRTSQAVQEPVYESEPAARPQRSWTKTAMIVGGSAAGGAGVGGLVGGKKGALVGAAIGGGAASIYEATRRR
jgi:hypothetical protein